MAFAVAPAHLDYRENPLMVALPATPEPQRRAVAAAPVAPFNVADYDVQNVETCPYVHAVAVQSFRVDCLVVLMFQGVREEGGQRFNRYEWCLPDDERIGNFIGFKGAHMSAFRKHRNVVNIHP